jgi:CheY-like chemotaxis protein
MSPGRYVALSVTDTGIGMAPEVAARAFDPFFTTKPLGEGTGLGLSMIYGFAKQSGGQVRIHSREGIGTTVRIYLPLHQGVGLAAAEAETRPDAPRAHFGETVLVVDDEPVIRMLVIEVLEELGYAALEAVDGRSGLRHVEAGGRIDLLVTDVGLPGGMNGRQFADAARVLRPGLKVLFITGFAENAAVGSGSMEPGMEVMIKPFAMDALAAKITAMINNQAAPP